MFYAVAPRIDTQLALLSSVAEHSVDKDALTWAREMELVLMSASVTTTPTTVRHAFLCDMEESEVATVADYLRGRFDCVGVLGWRGVEPGELSVAVDSPLPHVMLIRVCNSQDFFELVIQPMMNERYSAYKQTLAITKEAAIRARSA